MITVKQAQELTLANIVRAKNKQTELELSDIDCVVRDSIEMNLMPYKCYYPKKLSSETLLELSNIGYSVIEELDDRDRFNGYTISWNPEV